MQQPSLFRTVLLIAVFALATPFANEAMSKDKDKGNKRPNSREVYFFSEESIPPEANYMRDVMAQADLVAYIRNHISGILSSKHYRPHNYKLVNNRLKYNGKDAFLVVETDIDIDRESRTEFTFKVSMRADLYAQKDGKRLKKFKGKAKKEVKDRFRAGLIETIQEAYEPMKEKMPFYRGY